MSFGQEKLVLRGVAAITSLVSKSIKERMPSVWPRQQQHYEQVVVGKAQPAISHVREIELAALWGQYDPLESALTQIHHRGYENWTYVSDGMSKEGKQLLLKLLGQGRGPYWSEKLTTLRVLCGIGWKKRYLHAMHPKMMQALVAMARGCCLGRQVTANMGSRWHGLADRFLPDSGPPAYGTPQWRPLYPYRLDCPDSSHQLFSPAWLRIVTEVERLTCVALEGVIAV
jgi:hypothetical protein